jgi:hypothetical protein
MSGQMCRHLELGLEWTYIAGTIYCIPCLTGYVTLFESLLLNRNMLRKYVKC